MNKNIIKVGKVSTFAFGRLHTGDIPPKTAGKATHTLQCSWISMTAWWQHVSLPGMLQLYHLWEAP